MLPCSTTRVKPAALLLLLCGAGFLGNWFNLPLFFNVDFFFGSFFVMLAVVRFGVLPATLVGVAAASCTWLLWNHPWSILIFSAEALFVSLGNRRKPGNLVLLDTLYWLFLGIPLVWCFYYGGMGMSAQATVLVALKQSINGIINALLATLALYGLQLFKPAKGSQQPLISMREIIFTAMVSSALLPAFVYLVVDVRGSMRADEKDISRRIKSITVSSQDVLNAWFANNQQTVAALAGLVGDPNLASSGTIQQQVEALEIANPNILRLGVLDRNNRVIAFSPRVDQLGHSMLQQNFSDRIYVEQAKQSLKPLVTDVNLGKTGRPGPRVALVVPLVKDGRYLGLCVGSLNLPKLAEQLQILVQNRYSDVTILDRREKIVASTVAVRQPLQSYARPPTSEIRFLEEGIFHWIPKPTANLSVMQHWKDSMFVKIAPLSNELPWTIVVESSLVPYLNLLNQKTIDKFLLLWGILLLTLAVSDLLSRRIVSSISRLEKITANLPQQLDPEKKISWPKSNIRELHSLIANSRSMAAALGSTVSELVYLNQTLEERISVGTQALRESEEQYRRVVNTANEGIWIANQSLITTYVNHRLAEMLGYQIEEMVGQPITRFITSDHLVDYANRMRTRGQGHSEQFERYLRRRDGAEIWLLMSAAPMLNAEEQFVGTFAMCSDITARKRIEEALILKQGELEALNLSLESRIQQAVGELRQKDQIMITQSRQAAMGEMINNIAHQWRQPLNALGLVLSDIKDAYEFNELNQAYLEQATETGNQLVQQMSSTINDFRNFFRPDKELVAFSARNQIDAALALVAASFHNDNIAIHLDAPNDFKLLGFPNEYSQVLLNLISNAKEAILAAKVTTGRIDIHLKSDHDQGYVVFRDNGGGIPAEILPRIFEPYFSSKPLGTGIGLYMSKMIIERNMHGSIQVRNHIGGAEFTIVTPLAKEAP